ncbi:MAG: ABC transporter permease, partial [SAR324 cluster bacterium]|nr:ABC transporter permease [SAR324 cluster bacterium]
MGFFFNKNKKSDQQLKEAYFTASQVELISSRFKSNKTAMVAGWILTILILMGFFSEFLSPYQPTMA